MFKLFYYKNQFSNSKVDFFYYEFTSNSLKCASLPPSMTASTSKRMTG